MIVKISASRSCDDDDRKVGICRLCESVIKCPQSSTSRLWHHLRKNHVNEYDICKEGSSGSRVIDGEEIDLKCTICGFLPRRLFPSELYRHYSIAHFKQELEDDYGHLKRCTTCKLDLKGSSVAAAHFGQKHLHVQKYLQEDAWIRTRYRCGCRVEWMLKKKPVPTPSRETKAGLLLLLYNGSQCEILLQIEYLASPLHFLGGSKMKGRLQQKKFLFFYARFGLYSPKK